MVRVLTSCVPSYLLSPVASVRAATMVDGSLAVFQDEIIGDMLYGFRLVCACVWRLGTSRLLVV